MKGQRSKKEELKEGMAGGERKEGRAGGERKETQDGRVIEKDELKEGRAGRGNEGDLEDDSAAVAHYSANRNPHITHSSVTPCPSPIPVPGRDRKGRM